jgi:hypothetical protein
MSKKVRDSRRRKVMRKKNFMPPLIGAVLTAALISLPAEAQVSPTRLEALRSRMEAVKAQAQKLPQNKRNALSGGAQNWIRFAEHWNQIEPHLRQPPPRMEELRDRLELRSLGEAQTQPQVPPFLFGPVPVSDPSLDFLFSVLSGFTQSETSTAWCGNNVVVGYNDSGSILESFFFGPGGLSLDGVARSTNQGLSYTDLLFLNPGSNFFNVLIGDPVLGCTDSNTFYYTSLFQTGDFFTFISAISVSRSNNGGLSFADPTPAASKDGFFHFLDKPWMAVDPTDMSRIYVTYTDLDFSGTSPGCGPDFRTAIELVRSTDGGTTWSLPVVVEEACGDPFVQGSQVAVGPSGEVYVAWEFFDADFTIREINIGKSTDNGMSFGSPVKVDDVTCVGDCFLPTFLQGGFRSPFEFPLLAVDRSGTATDGNVYVTWNDGRNLQVPDPFSITGFYGYADVLLSRSTDGGASWSTPVRVNTNLEPLPTGRGTDQFQPGVAVDRTGKVGVCFYDRRTDPLNFFFDRFCAISTNAGATWTDSRQTRRRSAPFHATDVLLNPVYMGDYDSVVSDATEGNSGFIGAFQEIDSRGNPDVKAVKLP